MPHQLFSKVLEVLSVLSGCLDVISACIMILYLSLKPFPLKLCTYSCCDLIDFLAVLDFVV